MNRIAWTAALGLIFVTRAHAEEPTVAYLFPAGGQRGTKVEVRIGGHFLHGKADFQMTGPGIEVSPKIHQIETIWFEGPVIYQPDSQRKEDYPQDYRGTVKVASEAPVGMRYWRVSTSQGITAAMKFQIGDYPEVVEQEIDGQPIPQAVTLPVTINGRIFPREDVDLWTFEGKQGQPVRCEVHSVRLGYPLDARLEIRDSQGRRLAESLDAKGDDPLLHFVPPADGTYQVAIHDSNFGGLQHYVYRLTLTSEPYVDSVYPLGGKRGTTTRFELSGQALPQPFAEIALPSQGPADFAARATFGSQSTNAFWLELDDLPEHLEREPNDELDQGQSFQPPAILNGRIQSPGDLDVWTFEAQKGDVWELDLRAARLGSPLDSVLIVQNAEGKQLTRSDDLAGGETDSNAQFKVPADGRYTILVQDRFHSRGGREFAYRLHVTKAQPSFGFEIHLPSDALTLFPEQPAKLRLDLSYQGNFKAPLQLRFEGLPEGVTVTGTEVKGRRNRADLTLKADPNVSPGVYPLKVIGTVVEEGTSVTAVAHVPTRGGEPELDRLMLGVGVPTPFKITADYEFSFAPRGSLFKRHYRIEREGFEGPIEVSLADRQARHLQGVQGPKIVVPPGKSDFDYPIYLPPWMELGRTSRTVVMGIATVQDAQGHDHKVSYSSQKQEDQIIIRVDPALLSLHLQPQSIRATPGKPNPVGVRLIRHPSLKATVQIELAVPEHIVGVTAKPAEIAGDQSEGTLQIEFSPESGPFNLPLVVKATTKQGDLPIVGEAPLEVVPEK